MQLTEDCRRAAETGRGEIQPKAKSHRRSWALTLRRVRSRGTKKDDLLPSDGTLEGKFSYKTDESVK